jgi:hypothetical protein
MLLIAFAVEITLWCFPAVRIDSPIDDEMHHQQRLTSMPRGEIFLQLSAQVFIELKSGFIIFNGHFLVL